MPHRYTPLHLTTRLLHAGADPKAHRGAIAQPIYQSATFLADLHEPASSYEAITYVRLNNTPNHHTLHTRIAAIEGAQASLSFSSGMGAISSTLFSLLNPGDHIIASHELYGATIATLSKELARFGVRVDFVDVRVADHVAQAINADTRMIWLESMSNPLLHVPDLAGIAKLARHHGIMTVVDNTFGSPINFRPLEHGFDLSLHSATKYLNGHSDVTAGCVSGSRDTINEIARHAARYGACLNPQAAVMLERGMKTLSLRVAQQNSNTLTIASMLQDEHMDMFSALYYPGLEQSPEHVRARELFDGFGGVFAMKFKGGEAQAVAFIEALELASYAPSLGGVETLVTMPTRTSHASIDAAQREALGISKGLVRVSVGIEHAQDLCDDIEQALKYAAAVR